uniref:Short/branched chain specific acyl-CoA dehydrogenase, mitochondrial n=1 Tax=Palpitomonas bilix TaxID=652834 RepID=A0A7S3D986_9EUKA|mmetsp:Transcript_26858/g.69053  ORF Transcript_26858/g.69053 Transcript_26858/m.69053 type:complete len:409 (+) Transcript_26858:47-1273(+)
MLSSFVRNVIRSTANQTRLYTAGVLPSLYTFSDEENMMREAVQRFAKEELAPKVAEMDEKAQLDMDMFAQMFDLGLMGMEIPEKYGGTEMNFTSSCIVIEELAKVDPAVSVICDIQNTLINTAFMKYANEDLQEKYLPKLARDYVGSFALSEPGSGSDAFAMKTRADKVGNKYVINGGKCWISNAREAGVFLVFANVDPSKGYKGITAFAVDRNTEGLEIAKKENKLGIRASSTCTIHFNDMEVPEENIVGELGKGYKIAIGLLNEGRVGIAAQMLGLAQGVFDHTVPYLFQREQFGQAIGKFQGMQFQYAQCAADIEAARLMVYNAARMKEEGKDIVKQAAIAKLYASDVAEKVASKCVELMGGVGFTKEYPIEKYYRDCKIGKIYEGTSNIQLQTIAKLLEKEYSS